MEKTKSVKTTCELTFLGKSAKIKEGSPITLETLCGSSIIVASHELDVYLNQMVLHDTFVECSVH